MQRVTLEEGLVVYRCPGSAGVYIKAQDYWRWKQGHSAEEEAQNQSAAAIPVSEYDDRIKICPESGTLMLRYRVGHGLPFRLDRSVTGGVWLDAGEWDSLCEANLHLNLYEIFTASWQQAIREEQVEIAQEERLKARLGDPFHRRLTALREELWQHPAAAEAMAFLQRRS